jgi:hypothetical protein
MFLAAFFSIAALAAWSPYLIDFIFNGDRSGHIQSLILGAVLALAAVQMFALGIIGDALAGQRVLAQRAFERLRRLELEAGVPPSHYEPGQGPESLTVATLDPDAAPNPGERTLRG